MAAAGRESGEAVRATIRNDRFLYIRRATQILVTWVVQNYILYGTKLTVLYIC